MIREHDQFSLGDMWAEEHPIEYAQQKLIVWAILRKMAEYGLRTGQVPRVDMLETDRERLNTPYKLPDEVDEA